MFRLSKNIILMVITIVAFIVFLGIVKEYDAESIPNTTTSIQINSDSHHTNKSKLFSDITKLTKQGNYRLTLVRIVNVNGKKDKYVYSFNPSQKQIFSLYRNANIKKLNQKELQLTDFQGSYYTNAKKAQLAELQRYLNKSGLHYTTSKMSLLVAIKNNLALISYLPIVFSIFSILLIIMFIEKIAQLKKYAVLKLNGLNLWQILRRDLGHDYLFFIGSLLVVLFAYSIYLTTSLNKTGWILVSKYNFAIMLLILAFYLLLDLISYSCLMVVELYPALKGKSYTKLFVIAGYLLKASLVILVTINLFSLNNKVNSFIQDQNVMKMWINHHSGYTIQFADISNISHSEENKLGRLTRKLINHLDGVILAKNAQEFHPPIRDVAPENGNVLIVNRNYLNFNQVNSPTHQKIDSQALKPDELNILIPSSRMDQIKQFSKEIISFIAFQNELPGSNKQANKKLHYLEYASGQDVFNYTIGKDIQDSISHDPIIVIDDNCFADNFYFAAASQGMIQFSNLKQLQSNIKRFSLENYITGITDAKTRLSNFNIEQSRQISLVAFIILISLSQLLLIIAFISLAFLQKQRLKMAITKIFGQSNRKTIFNFWVTNLVGDSLLILALLVLSHQNWPSLLYLLPYLVIETGVIWLLALRAQQQLLVTLNHGN
ncbi:Bacteriocin-associated integral membrane protein [Lactobacillus gigeriorum DSM 23908 = CRBIP 24.85]|nr:Bacteriocin-associated integral membrane protein [Lactobacillus gigeriorum DSM 23908 = CRBIP 24.85]